MIDLKLQGKHAVVCGSTQGIGRAVASELAQMGATITLVARNEESLQEVLKMLDHQHGQKHSYFCVDFSHPDDLKAKIEQFIQEHPPVHILV